MSEEDERIRRVSNVAGRHYRPGTRQSMVNAMCKATGPRRQEQLARAAIVKHCCSTQPEPTQAATDRIHATRNGTSAQRRQKDAARTQPGRAAQLATPRHLSVGMSIHRYGACHESGAARHVNALSSQRRVLKPHHARKAPHAAVRRIR